MSPSSSRPHPSTIFTARPDGSDQHKLGADGYFDTNPSWSPTGHWIVYISIRGEHANLYQIRPDSTDEHLLIPDVDANTLPVWSPDGRWIAVVRNIDNNPDIYRVRNDGSNLERLTTNPDFDGFPRWSPAGQWIAYISRIGSTWNLHCMTPDGTAPEQLNSIQPLSQRPPSWSPDSQWIAFESQSGDIFRIRFDGDAIQQLTLSSARNMYPSWSPDGQWIAFIAVGENGMSVLHKMRSDGSQRQKVYDEPVTMPPLWSPQPIQSAYEMWKLMGGAFFMLAGVLITFWRSPNPIPIS